MSSGHGPKAATSTGLTKLERLQIDVEHWRNELKRNWFSDVASLLDLEDAAATRMWLPEGLAAVLREGARAETPAPTTHEVLHGTVDCFFAEKGYGYVRPDAPSSAGSSRDTPRDQLHVHWTDVAGQSLYKGDRVTFVREWDKYYGIRVAKECSRTLELTEAPGVSSESEEVGLRPLVQTPPRKQRWAACSAAFKHLLTKESAGNPAPGTPKTEPAEAARKPWCHGKAIWERLQHEAQASCATNRFSDAERLCLLALQAHHQESPGRRGAKQQSALLQLREDENHADWGTGAVV